MEGDFYCEKLKMLENFQTVRGKILCQLCREIRQCCCSSVHRKQWEMCLQTVQTVWNKRKSNRKWRSVAACWSSVIRLTDISVWVSKAQQQAQLNYRGTRYWSGGICCQGAAAFLWRWGPQLTAPERAAGSLVAHSEAELHCRGQEAGLLAGGEDIKSLVSSLLHPKN